MEEDLPQSYGQQSGLIGVEDVGDQLQAFKEHDEFDDFDDAQSIVSDGMESYAAAQTVFARKDTTVQQYERYISFLFDAQD
jgi:Mg2+/Co2+ transporter CorC